MIYDIRMIVDILVFMFLDIDFLLSVVLVLLYVKINDYWLIVFKGVFVEIMFDWFVKYYDIIGYDLLVLIKDM